MGYNFLIHMLTSHYLLVLYVGRGVGWGVTGADVGELVGMEAAIREKMQDWIHEMGELHFLAVP
jgi:hypothetical protein